MSNKKTANMGATGNAGAQENLNVLYTAHQVHTLAQIVFQQLAGSLQQRTSWQTTTPFQAGGSFGQNVPQRLPGAGFVQAPPALFYWYP